MSDIRNNIAKIVFDEKYRKLYGTDCDKDREYSYQNEDFREECRDRLNKTRYALRKG